MPKRIPDIPSNHGLETRAALTAQKLRQQPVHGSVGYMYNGTEKYLDLFVGSSNNYIIGDILVLDSKIIATIMQLYVARPLRGKRLGERLLTNFISEAKAMGAQELWSDNVSNDALKVRSKIFDKSALSFYDSDHPEFGFLAMDYEQALATNHLISTVRDPENGQPSKGDIGVYVNLDQVDTTMWERPSSLTNIDLGVKL